MRPRFLSLALFALLAVAACPRKTAIWILGQASAGRPVFGVSTDPHGSPTWLGYLIVSECEPFDGRRALWALEPMEGTPPAVASITFGSVPNGYRRRSNPADRPGSPPPSLRPGCYIAATDGTGQVRFKVDSSGFVLEQSKPSEAR
jgi:hypothetical protein